MANSLTEYASQLSDFSDLLRLAAKSRNLPAAIIEKDYYLTRALCALAEAHSRKFVLKGGTSLSKGWGLLQRFSEDIDLLLRDDGATNTEKHKRLRRCANTIKQTEGFESLEVRNSETGVHRTVAFGYSSVSTDLPGLSKTVLLEAGYRGNATQAVTRPIRSMLTEFSAAHGHGNLAADLSPFDIEAQSLQRTFVEKLFAAHAAYLRNFAADGKARHYYDLYEMCNLEEIKAFAGTADYRRCIREVREFSQQTFPEQGLPESESFTQSPAFNPDGDGLKTLEKNYKAEAELFFIGQPLLADVLKAISDLLPQL